MDFKSLWLAVHLIDTGKSDYNGKITCFNFFDTPFMCEPAYGLNTFISGSSRTL